MAVKDTIRFYDDAVRNWARSFTVNGSPVETTFATPDRPWGRFKDEDEFRSTLMKSNLIVSITRLDLMYDPRHRIDFPWGPVWQSEDGSAAVLARYPRPYTFQYQLDLRARRRTDANLWLQWLLFTCNPYHVFEIDFGKPWGLKKLHGILQNQYRDTTDLESGEKERWIRYTATVEIIGFMFVSVDEIDPMAENTDVPDTYGQLIAGKPVLDAQVDIYVQKRGTDSINPADPDNELVDTVRRTSDDV